MSADSMMAQTGDGSDSQDGGAPDMSQGYTIEIKVGPGNKVQSVGVEPATEESSEESADGAGVDMGAESEAGDTSGTAVGDWKSAMQVASDIYRNAGDMSESNDRASIAKEVFGGSEQKQAGDLARKPRTVGGY